MRRLELEIIKLQESTNTIDAKTCAEAIKLKKSCLADLLGIKAQGALVRSRFQNLAQMDAPSKFFFSLERKSGQSRYIHSLRSENGLELTEPPAIRRRAVQFYAGLYSSEYNDDKEQFVSFFEGLSQISKRSKVGLEQTLSEQEFHAALRSMEGGKAPGIDGLPVEFYQAFWAVMGRTFWPFSMRALLRALYL